MNYAPGMQARFHEPETAGQSMDASDYQLIVWALVSLGALITSSPVVIRGVVWLHNRETRIRKSLWVPGGYIQENRRAQRRSQANDILWCVVTVLVGGGLLGLAHASRYHVGFLLVGVFLLMGGLAGLLLWLAYKLARIFMRERKYRKRRSQW